MVSAVGNAAIGNAAIGFDPFGRLRPRGQGRDSGSQDQESGPGGLPAVGQTRGADGKPLEPEEQQAVKELRKRDREVRAHEQAHLAAGGPYARGPYYEYQVGPDGKRYAVGGSVSIDTSPIPDNPSATISKLETVIRAALAPVDPSGQDLQVAAQARQAKLEAQAQLNAERTAKLQGTDGEAAGPGRSGTDGTGAGGVGNATFRAGATPRRGSLIDLVA